jgi:FKBP-type peptidyl-prolyl cis-trans isomerase FklB
MMPVGSKWELYIPQELAYGERPAGKIKPYSTLIFTVELEGIESEKKPEAKTEAKTAETKAKAKTAKVTKKK